MGGLLAVIPARGGSKGLPRKNLRPLAGLPLIGHSIKLAELCPEIGRTVVSTDDEEIAAVARELGAEVLRRPAELARDETPMLPVLRHALEAAGGGYEFLLLLDPTAPIRLPEDVAAAHARLLRSPGADGVVSVSEPEFSPIWQCVVERDGLMEHLVSDGARYERRQDVPRVLRINGAVYIWRTEFLRREPEHWLRGRHVLYETPAARALDIDEEWELERCEALLRAGVIRLPWLEAP